MFGTRGRQRTMIFPSGASARPFVGTVAGRYARFDNLAVTDPLTEGPEAPIGCGA